MTTSNQIPKTNGQTHVKVLDELHGDLELSTKNPLPITFGGEALTTFNGFEYIPIFAPLDNLFRSLLELRLLSPTQSACIGDKTFYSIGAGLELKDKDFPTEFDKKINGKGETVDDVLKSVFDSLFQDGNAFIELARTTVGSDKFVQAFVHNNMDCRFEAKKNGSDPTHVLRSKHFRRDSYYMWSKDEAPIRIPLWTDDPINKTNVWRKTAGGVERTMLHIKNNVKGIDYYGLPTNFAGFINAVLEWKAARFNGDNFDNNMFIGGLLYIQGSMSDEEERDLVKKIRKAQTGEGKGMRIIPISSEGGIQDTKFVPFTENHEGHFIEFDKHNEDKIIGANGWSRALLDMQQSGSMGKGGEYLKNLFKMKYQTVIMPVQQNVLNNFVFPLMKIIDEYKSTKFYDMQWTIKPVIPVTLEGLLDINSLLTVDEGRKEIGRDELGGEKGKKLISEVKAKPPAPLPGKKEEAAK